MTDSNTYLAVDLGGTKLLVGEVNKRGEVLKHKKYTTGYINQSTAFAIIKKAVNDYINDGWATGAASVAMGVGLIGRVDNTGGEWLQIDPKRTEVISLAKELTKTFGMPCYIDNDVKSATRAEKLWGCGAISNNYIYINAGTGIAAGFVINGALVRGSHFNAGEVGHTNVGVSIGIKCGCGRMDCVELIASGMGFDRSARLMQQQYTTRLHIPDDSQRVDVRDVYRLYSEGDALCIQLVENAAKAIASLIMNLVRVSDPDTVVLGGGIVSSGFLLPKIQSYLNPSTMRFVTNGVVLTKLNPDFIGLTGAGAVAMNM
ncbi:MAG: ROK family protein [Cytophagaceae bacterium]|jgi:predicted NBD/HSP70 family sugar kinase|nr:ROK family protein [Cytophagaceae bacterium]